MIELHLDDMAHGGAAVGRLDGKAHFVDGAMPGERVRGVLARDAGAWAKVDLIDVVDASPQRVDPECPHFATCGGCQWQYASRAAQLEWKRSIVAGQLAHIGGLREVEVRDTVAPSAPYGYRNRMDFRVVQGRPALTKRNTRSPVTIDTCAVLHPAGRALFDALGPMPGTTSLTIRCGAGTGDVLVVVRGEVPPRAGSWEASVAHDVRGRLRTVRGTPAIEEIVDGHRLRISGTTFFQANTEGAQTLVDLVRAALRPEADDVLLDAYAGGGLFSVALGGAVTEVVAVEAAPDSVADLVHNLEAADAEATVIEGKVERVAGAARPEVDLAIVDPPRRGLKTEGVDAIVSLNPRTIAYVSCDPASLARDARLLRDEGYALDHVVPVDMFPQTFHVEAVARFTR